MNKKLPNFLRGTVLVLLTFHQAAKAQTGAALNFDASNDFISVGAPNNIPIGNSPYTIESWIKPNAFGGYGIIGWGNYGTYNEVNALRLDAGGFVHHYWWGNDLSAYPSIGIPSINLLDGNWHHVAATFDGTTRKLYVDGFLKASDTPGSHNVTTASNFRIGSTCPPCGGEIFNGGIDEIRVWNVARSQCQLRSYMACEIPSTATGLILNYHFNNGVAGSSNPTVSTILDISGSGNTGVLNNFALTGPTSNWIAPGGVVSGSTTPSAPTITSGALTVNSGSICSGNSFTIVTNSGPTYTVTGGSLVVSPTSNTSYTVMANIGADGCLLSPSVAVSSVTVASLPLPVITVTANTSVVCLNQELILTGIGGSYYKWSMGGVGTNYAFHPMTTATYTVYGYDNNGCYNSATISATVTNCTAIEELNSSTLFSVYPNPSNGEFFLDVNTENTIVTIYDVIGNIVYTENLNLGKHQVNLNDHAAGLYFIQAKNNDRTFSARLIKQ